MFCHSGVTSEDNIQHISKYILAIAALLLIAIVFLVSSPMTDADDYGDYDPDREYWENFSPEIGSTVHDDNNYLDYRVLTVNGKDLTVALILSASGSEDSLNIPSSFEYNFNEYGSTDYPAIFNCTVTEFDLNSLNAKEFNIPKTVVNINQNMFRHLNSSCTIVVDEGNPVYSCVDGFLLCDDGRTVVCKSDFVQDSSILTKFDIPENVTKLLAYSMSKTPTSGDVMITFPESLMTIEPDAFYIDGYTSISFKILDDDHNWIDANIDDIKGQRFGRTSSDDGTYYMKKISGVGGGFTHSGVDYRITKYTETDHFVTIQRNENCDSIKAYEPNGRIYYLDDVFTITDIDCMKGCTLLKSVTLPETITSIPTEAFSGCVNLTDFEAFGLTAIPDYAFYDTGEMSLSLQRAEAIGAHAFENSSVKSISTGAKTIGYRAFYNASGLTNITLDYAETIGIEAFSGCVNLTDFNATTSLISISDYAFYDTGEMSLSLHTTESIGAHAFENSRIKRISTTAKTIEERAFYNTSNLTSAELAGAESIGTEAFASSGLTYVNFSGMLKDIGSYAFANTKINSLELHDFDLKNISDHAFFNSEISTLNIDSQNLETIGDYAFANTNIYTLELKNSFLLKNIGDHAFANTKITTLDLEELHYLETIGDYAFANTPISYVKMPLPNNSDPVISDSAFYGCYYLKTFEFCNYEWYHYETIYSSDDTALYNADRTELIRYLENSNKGTHSMNIVSTVKTIRSYAVCGSELLYIDTISIPKTVEHISADAFTYSYDDNGEIKTEIVRFYEGDTLIEDLDDLIGHTFKADENDPTRMLMQAPKYYAHYYDETGKILLHSTEYGNGCNIDLTVSYSDNPNMSFMGWKENGEHVESAVMRDCDRIFTETWGYDVTFDTDGGPVIEGTRTEHDQFFTIPDYEMEKTDYVFIGWLINGSYVEDSDCAQPGYSLRITEHTSFKAVWGYTVTYDLDEGTGNIPNTKIEAGMEYTIQSDCEPTLNGYHFLGWMVNGEHKSDCSYPENGSKITVDGDTVLKAVWGFEVTYDPNGGDRTVIDKSERDCPYYIKDVDIKNGKHTLVHWTLNGEKCESDDPITVAKDTTLTAVWGFRITYDLNGGEGTAQDIKVVEGGSYTIPEEYDPARDNMHFMGWMINDTYRPNGDYTAHNTTFENITADIRLTAVWGYEILYFFNGGKCSIEDPSTMIYVECGKDYVIPESYEPSKEGHVFMGWRVYNGAECEDTLIGTNESIRSKANITLSAVWGYRITFDKNGGSGYTEDTVVETDSSYTVPKEYALINPGFVSMGWKINGNTFEDGRYLQNEELYTPTCHTVLTAAWGKNVKYEPNGGNRSKECVVEYNTIYKIEDIGTLKDGYVLMGWTINGEEPSDGVYASTDYEITIKEDIVLSAVWGYSITYDLNGGTCSNIKDDVIRAGTSYTIPETYVPELKDRVFLGWMVNGQKKPIDGYMKSGTVMNDIECCIVLDAVWGYTVTYDLNSGSCNTEDVLLEVGTKYKIPGTYNAFRDGFTFMGWKINNEFRVDGQYVKPDTELDLSKNTILKATWGYDITYDTNGGDCTVSDVLLEEGLLYLIPGDYLVRKDGCTFMGWSKNNEYKADGQYYLAGDDVEVTSHTVFKAVFGYRVQYDKNCGYGDISDHVVEIGHSYTIPESYIVYRYGMDFVGWKINGETKDLDKYTRPGTELGILDSHTSLLAVFAYSVTYDINGGSCTAENGYYEYGCDYTIPLSYEASRDGHNFMGWKINGQYRPLGDYTLPGTTLVPDSHVVLKAVWGFDLTYDLNGGVCSGITKENIIEMGTEYTIPTYNITRDTLHLMGWMINGEFKEDGRYAHPGTDITVDSDIALKAIWGYEVDYKPDAETGTIYVHYCELGQEHIVLNSEIKKTGYVLVGWKVNGEYLPDIKYAKVGQPISITKDTELTAVWGHSITYDLNGGACDTENTVVEKGESYTIPDDYVPTIQGNAVFLGWMINNKTVSDGNYSQPGTELIITCNTKLTAVWGYKVTYDLNGGDGTPKVVTVEFGKSHWIHSDDAQMDGYVLVKWLCGTTLHSNNSFIKVTSEITLVAQWYKKIQINYDLNGAPGEIETKTDYVNHTFTVSDIGEITYDGHEFGGWYKDDDTTRIYAPGSTAETSDDDITMHAVWYKILDVNYNLGNDAIGTIDKQSVKENTQFTVKGIGEITYDGYEFGGWIIDGNNRTYQKGDKITIGEEDITLNALWLKLYTISYNADGGSYTPDSFKVAQTKTFRICSYTGVKDGFEFDGWVLSYPYHGTRIFDDTDVLTINDNDLEFTAKWTPTHKVIYKDVSGEILFECSCKEGSSVRISSDVNPTKEGYELHGWNCDGELVFAGSKVKMSDCDIILTANWIKLYKVIYMIDGDTEYKTDVCGQNMTFSPKYTPEISGKRFDGWSIAEKINGTWKMYSILNKNAIITMGSSDIYLMANWTLKHTVHYMYDTECESAYTQEIAEGDRFTISGPSLKKEYAIADGWVLGTWDGKEWRLCWTTIYHNLSSMQMDVDDIYLFANWISAHYVEYSLDGGNTIWCSDLVADNSEITIIRCDVKKSDSLFINWTYNNEQYESDTSFTISDQNIRFIANWLPLHNVYFYKENGQTLIKTMKVGEGREFEFPSYDGTKDGGVFIADGWVASDEKTYDFGSTYTMGENDLQFNVNWLETHLVIFDLDGGSGNVKEMRIGENKEFILPEYLGTKCVDENKGEWKIGDGWIDTDGKFCDFGSTYTMGENDLKFKVQWCTAYTISFDVNGGSKELETLIVKNNSQYELPNYDGDLEGYYFAYWLIDGHVSYPGSAIIVDKDVIVEVYWKECYTVTFAHGLPVSEDITYTVKDDSVITIPQANTSNSGYKFCGWALEGDGSRIYQPGSHYLPTYNAVFKAVWKETVSVSFITNNDDYEDSKYDVIKNSFFTIPEFDMKKKGYKFIGWDNGTEPYSERSSVFISEDTTFEAVWAELSTIYFDLNGLGDNFTREIPVGDTLKLPYPQIDDAYEFSGWILNNKIKTAGTEIIVTGPTMLFNVKAVEKDKISVYLDPNNDPESNEYLEYKVYKNTTFTIPYINIDGHGKFFVNWKNGDNEYNPGAKINVYDESIVLTAQWSNFPVVNSEFVNDNMLYSVNEDCISVTLEKCNIQIGNVTIPNEVWYKGFRYVVTDIGDCAFMDKGIYGTLTIPDNIERIGEKAFFGCKDIDSIKIGKSLYYIGEMAFSNMSWTSLTISTDNQSYSAKDDMIYRNNHSLIQASTIVTNICDSNITYFGPYSLYNCTKLTTVQCADYVTVCNHAFEGCSSLISISAKEINAKGNGAFLNCISLNKTLHLVGEIGTYAFTGCESLYEVTISCKNVGSYGFYNCTGLTKVTLDDNVNVIEFGAFFKCSNLKHIIISDSVIAFSSAFDCRFYEHEYFIDNGRSMYFDEISGYEFKGDGEIMIAVPPIKISSIYIPTIVVKEDTLFKDVEIQIYAILPTGNMYPLKCTWNIDYSAPLTDDCTVRGTITNGDIFDLGEDFDGIDLTIDVLKKHTISFKASENNGSVTYTEFILYDNDTFTFVNDHFEVENKEVCATETKDGYYFVWWEYKGEPLYDVTKKFKADKDYEFIAFFSTTYIRIHFDSGSEHASGTMYDEIYVSNYMSLPDCEFVYTNYSFLKWSTKSAHVRFVSDDTLYYRGELDRSTITLSANWVFDPVIDRITISVNNSGNVDALSTTTSVQSGSIYDYHIRVHLASMDNVGNHNLSLYCDATSEWYHLKYDTWYCCYVIEGEEGEKGLKLGLLDFCNSLRMDLYADGVHMDTFNLKVNVYSPTTIDELPSYAPRLSSVPSISIFGSGAKYFSSCSISIPVKKLNFAFTMEGEIVTVTITYNTDFTKSDGILTKMDEFITCYQKDPEKALDKYKLDCFDAGPVKTKFGGYVIFKYDLSTNEGHIVEGAFTVKVNGAMSETHQSFMPVIYIPITWTIGINLEGKLILGLLYDPDSNTLSFEGMGKIIIGGFIEGGIGFRRMLSAVIGFNSSITFIIDFSKVDQIKTYMKGSMELYGVVYLVNNPIYRCSIYKIQTDTIPLFACSNCFFDNLRADPDQWDGNYGELMDAISELCYPQIIVTPNGEKLMIFSVLNENGNVKLCYTSFNEDTKRWSIPDFVSDDMYSNESNSSIINIDGRTYLVYGVTTGELDEDSPDYYQYMNGTEICCCEWNGNSFNRFVTLTDDAYCDYSVKVVKSGDDSLLVWLKNCSDSDVDGTTYVMCYDLKKNKYVGIESDDGLTYLYATDNIIVDYDVSFDENGYRIFTSEYVVMNENEYSLETNEHILLGSTLIDSELIELDTPVYSSSYIPYGDGYDLIMISNGKLYKVDSSEAKVVFESSTLSGPIYTFEHNGSYWIYWTDDYSGLIYLSEYKGNGLSAPIVIDNYAGNKIGSCFISDINGELIICATVSSDGEKYALYCDKISSLCDGSISIDDFELIRSSNDADLELTVTNLGETVINGFSIEYSINERSWIESYDHVLQPNDSINVLHRITLGSGEEASTIFVRLILVDDTYSGNDSDSCSYGAFANEIETSVSYNVYETIIDIIMDNGDLPGSFNVTLTVPGVGDIYSRSEWIDGLHLSRFVISNDDIVFDNDELRLLFAVDNDGPQNIRHTDYVHIYKYECSTDTATVTYDNCIVDTQSVEYGWGDVFILPDEAENESGYTLDHWTDGRDVYEPGSLYTVYSDVVIKAVFDIVKIRLVTQINSVTESYGESFVQKDIPFEIPAIDIHGYEISKVFLNGVELTDHSFIPTDDCEIVLELTKKMYDITFKNYDGSVIRIDSYEYGTEKEQIVMPSDKKQKEWKYGYEYYFVGWSPAITDVTEDKTYTAYFIERCMLCITSFDVNGGSVDIDDVEILLDSEYTVPAYEGMIKGYKFMGFMYDGTLYGCGDKILVEEPEIHFTAYWSAITYDIKFVMNGASPIDSIQYTIESDDVILSDPVRNYYTFGGWFENPEFKGDAVTTIAHGNIGDITLYAKWTPNTRTVSIDNDISKTYDGTAADDVEYTLSAGSGEVTVQYREGTGQFTTAAPVDAGTYTVRVSVADDGNYPAVYDEKEFTIGKAVSSYIIGPESMILLTYNGGPLVLVYGGTTDCGTVVYSVNGGEFRTDVPTGIKAGEYGICCRIIGDRNHSDSDVIEFTTSIGKAYSNIIDAPETTPISYGQMLSDSSLIGGNTDVKGRFVWELPTLEPSVSDSDITEYRLIFIPEDMENYWTNVTYVTLTVDKATIEWPDIPGRMYNGSEQSASIREDPRYDVVSNNGGTDVGRYPVTLRLNDTDNYRWTDTETAEKTVIDAFEIIKSFNCWLGEFTTSGKTYDGKVLDESNYSVSAFYGTAVFTVYDSEFGGSAITEPKDAGTYWVSAKVIGTSNYDGIAETGRIPVIIERVTVTVTPQIGQSKIFGHDEPELLFDFESEFDGELNHSVFSGALSRAVGENTGEYVIGLGTLTIGSIWAPQVVSDNYLLVLNDTPVYFSIERAHIAIPTADGTALIFNGAEQTYLPIGFDSKTMLISDNIERNIGEYTATVSIKDKQNYLWTDGGQEDVQFTFTIKGEYEPLPIPTKAGYTFGGWYDNPRFTGCAYTENLKHSGIVYYPKWTPIEYTIVYVTNGGTPIDDKKYTIETETFDLCRDTYIDGYSMTYWYYNEDLEGEPAPDRIVKGSFGDMTLYAGWAIIDYMISYWTSGGTELYGSYRITDETFDLPIPEKDNYIFEGWYEKHDLTGGEITQIVKGSFGDLDLYAKWTPVEYELSYDGVYGGTYTVEDETFDLPIPEKDNYIFEGWYAEEDLSGDRVVKVEKGSFGDRAYYSKWTPEMYTLTYYSTDSPTVCTPEFFVYSEDTYTIEDDIDLIIPERWAYVFQGWYLDPYVYEVPIEKISAGSAGDIGLYAKWTPEIYTLTYHSNGGSDVSPTEYTFEGGPITLPVPEKNSYVFDGWYECEDFQGLCFFAITSGAYEDKTLYAKWVPIVYTVSFMSGGGSDIDSIPYTVEDTVAGFEEPVREGYTFIGWFDEDDEPVYSIPAGSCGDVVLTAKWSLDKHTISLFDDGGEILSEISGYYGSESVLPDIIKSPTAEFRYTFIGWFDENDVMIGSPMRIVKDVSLYAKFSSKIRSYDVTFNVDGKMYSSYTGEYGKEIVLPADPEKASDGMTAFEFISWSGYASGSKIEGDMVFEAVFKKIAVVDMGSEVNVNVTEQYANLDSGSINEIKQKAAEDPETTLSMSIGGYKVIFDSNALKNIDTTDSCLSVSKYTEDVPELEGVDKDHIYEISFDNNHDFRDGKVTISIPYELKEGEDENDLVIYYIVGGAVSEKINCTYSEGFITFSTNHFSTYAVASEESVSEERSAYPAVACIIAALITVLAAVMIVRRQ